VTQDALPAACTVCRSLPVDNVGAIAWPAPVAADEWVRDDRIRGAYLGLAVGDALGALHHGGRPRPADMAPGSLVTGGATQLALFTAEGLLRMQVRFAEKGIGPAWGAIRHALDRWMVTQGRTPKTVFAWDPKRWPDGWLVRQHRMHRRVEGFGATVEALGVQADTWGGMPEEHRAISLPNTSNGAGALVRVLAAGIVARPEHATLVGAITSAITHGGADGYLAGAALARVVSGLVAGVDVGHAVQAARSDLGAWPDGQGVRAALGDAAAASSAGRALAAGLHYASFATPDDPVITIERAIVAGGTAAGVVAGVLAGARLGASRLPSEWLAATDLAGVVEEIARASSAAHRAWVMERDLAGLDANGDGPFEEDPACGLFWPRFPGW
jgi:ADP-ribosylglycohydrolase